MLKEEHFLVYIYYTLYIIVLKLQSSKGWASVAIGKLLSTYLH